MPQMARWDEILSLPVQNPPTLEFSSADLVWSKVEGWRDNIDRVALIPFARVDDFVRGESANKDCPTRFHVEARRRRPPEMPYKPKVDGILEYILYWCSFGPDDHRKGGIVRPSRSTYVPKKKSAGRPNTKRGCTCHFIVKRLIAEPSVALIIYNQDKHVDKKGLPCHGPHDKKAVGTRAMFAPYISEDLRLRVLSLLHVGVSVETIMQRHNESVERQGGPCNRDDLLTHRYVRRQERSIRRSTYELDTDDAISIRTWVESHLSHVFFYQDFSDSEPFTLGIQTEWQLQQMICFGNRSLVASDSRFGTNKLKYPIHSLIVFNSDKKAIPVAWIIAPAFSSGDAHKWMRALYSRVHTKDPTWKLAGFIVDDPLADVITIRLAAKFSSAPIEDQSNHIRDQFARKKDYVVSLLGEVFQCSVLICFWRVRHAWHKNLVKKCPGIEMRAEIFRQLGQAVSKVCREHATMGVFEDLMEDLIDSSTFMDYFKAIWYPRLGMWISMLQTLPLASQETCAAMEFYHNQLKLRLLNEKDHSVYQRADWLIDKLGTKVHSYFWLDEYSGKDDFSRYRRDEWVSGLTSWRKALKIPDSDVALEGRFARVINRQDQDRAHTVWNPGSEYAVCDCSWSEMGNLCEHVLKVVSICRNNGSSIPSISLYQYKQALENMLNCPPNDSLIRDHAVSLAVHVQILLNALIDPESSQTTLGVSKQQQNGVASADQQMDIRKESKFQKENLSSRYSEESGDGVGHDAPDSIGGVLVGDLNGQVVSEEGYCGETAGEEVPCSDMDVDPSSICNPPSGLFSLNGFVPSDDFLEKGERCLVDTELDIPENHPSEVDALRSQNGFGDDSDALPPNMMDMEPHINSPMVESTEECKMILQNGDCSENAGPSLASTSMEGNPQSNENFSHLLSKPIPVEVHLLDLVETSGDTRDKERSDLVPNDISETGDRSLVDTELDIPEIHPSEGDAFASQNGSEGDAFASQNGFGDDLDTLLPNEMDMEPHIVPQMVESTEECKIIHQNGDCSENAGSSIVSTTVEGDPQSGINFSCSSSKPILVEVHRLDMAETSGVTKDRERTELETERSPSKNLPLTDNADPLNGVQDM